MLGDAPSRRPIGRPTGHRAQYRRGGAAWLPSGVRGTAAGDA